MSKGDHFPARTIYYLNQQPRLQEDKPQRSVYIVHQQQQGMEQNTQNFPPNLPPFSSVSMPSTTALISSRSSTQSPQIISSSASRSSASSPALMSSSNDTIVQPSEQVFFFLYWMNICLFRTSLSVHIFSSRCWRWGHINRLIYWIWKTCFVYNFY